MHRKIPLPRGWKRRTKAAILHILALSDALSVPIGVPIGWGTRTGLSGFKEGLAALGRGRWARFYDVAEQASEISLERPFYPRGSLNKPRQIDLIVAHDVPDIDALRRQCERATADRRAACRVMPWPKRV